MQIAVLGPLEVTDRRRRSTHRGARRQGALAPRRARRRFARGVVSTDRIVESPLERGPAGHRSQVAPGPPGAPAQRLGTRPAAGAPTGRYVVRRGSGYALAAPRGRRRVAHRRPRRSWPRPIGGWGSRRGRPAARRRPSPSGAAEPFGDWPDPSFAEAERRRLAELRSGALTALLEARLALGERAEVAAEAERLPREDPLRRTGGGCSCSRCTAAAVRATHSRRQPGPGRAVVEPARCGSGPAVACDGGGGPRPGPGARPARPLLPGSACPLPAPRPSPPAPTRGWRATRWPMPPLFHGRGRVVGRLVGRLVDAPLLVVSGSSGAGKSSLVRAGLLPGPGRWRAPR